MTNDYLQSVHEGLGGLAFQVHLGFPVERDNFQFLKQTTEQKYTTRTAGLLHARNQERHISNLFENVILKHFPAIDTILSPKHFPSFCVATSLSYN